MSNSGSFTQIGIYDKITLLSAKANTFLIGFGRYNSWDIDLSPPPTSGVEVNVEEVFGFIPVREIYGVAPTNEDSIIDFAVKNTGYKKVENSQLAVNKVNTVCFEGTLYHTDLPQNSWRIISLFESASAIVDQRFINPPYNATLRYLSHNRPKTKEESAVEVIRLLLPIGGGL